MAKKQLSGALKLTDLNDFISPSQACVKPVEIEKTTTQVAEIITNEEGRFQVLESGEKRKLEKAQISLADCLACRSVTQYEMAKKLADRSFSIEGLTLLSLVG